MTFGEALKAVRHELGWTQPQLAREIYDATDGRIDLSPAEISRYERGRVISPRLDVVRAAAKATNRPLAFFSDAEEVGLSAGTFRDSGADGRRPDRAAPPGDRGGQGAPPAAGAAGVTGEAA